MADEWLSTDWEQAGLVALSAVAILAAVIAVSRISGLRTFSKMSSFDFAITIATGSIVAAVAASSTSLANGVIALAVLYACQWLVAQSRRRSFGSKVVDNTPILLMLDGEMIERNLTSSRVTRDDVMAKLREANVLRLSDVRAVVLETTGDVSVLHGEGPVDAELLAGLAGVQADDTAPAGDVDWPVTDPQQAAGTEG